MNEDFIATIPEYPQFMQQYGNQFANDESLGFAILAYLKDSGVDISAADSVVQSAVNKLRSEVDDIMHQFKQQEEANRIRELQQQGVNYEMLSQLMSKLQAVDNAVQATQQEEFPAEQPPMPDTGVQPPVDIPPEATMPPEATSVPPEAMVPLEAAPENVPAPEVSVPPEAAAPAPMEPATQPPVPDATVSDSRMKNFKDTYYKRKLMVVSDAKTKHIKKPVAKPASDNFTFANNILSACQGGY